MANLELAKRDITFFVKTNFRNEYKKMGLKQKIEGSISISSVKPASED